MSKNGDDSSSMKRRAGKRFLKEYRIPSCRHLQLLQTNTLCAPPFSASVTHVGACAPISVTPGLGQLTCSYFQLCACRKHGKSQPDYAQVFTELAAMSYTRALNCSALCQRARFNTCRQSQTKTAQESFSQLPAGNMSRGNEILRQKLRDSQNSNDATDFPLQLK